VHLVGVSAEAATPEAVEAATTAVVAENAIEVPLLCNLFLQLGLISFCSGGADFSSFNRGRRDEQNGDSWGGDRGGGGGGFRGGERRG
jgi:hypothetical protein